MTFFVLLFAPRFRPGTITLFFIALGRFLALLLRAIEEGVGDVRGLQKTGEHEKFKKGRSAGAGRSRGWLVC